MAKTINIGIRWDDYGKEAKLVKNLFAYHRKGAQQI